MLIVLSPAKTLDFGPLPAQAAASKVTTNVPEMLTHSDQLAGLLKQQTPGDLRRLMGISESLAQLNHERFQNWETPHPESASKAALFAFRGDVYLGLDADSLTPKQLMFAEEHLRILSGLYGVLRPLDRILPYRLEMGTSLENPAGGDLYAFWKERVTDAIVAQIEANSSRFLLNLASQEYFRCIDASRLPVPCVAPAFKEFKNGKYKMISFFAKKARGTMAAWAIRKKMKTLSSLLKFDEDGYRYDADTSTPEVPVFLRGG